MTRKDVPTMNTKRSITTPIRFTVRYAINSFVLMQRSTILSLGRITDGLTQKIRYNFFLIFRKKNHLKKVPKKKE